MLHRVQVAISFMTFTQVQDLQEGTTDGIFNTLDLLECIRNTGSKEGSYHTAQARTVKLGTGRSERPFISPRSGQHGLDGPPGRRFDKPRGEVRDRGGKIALEESIFEQDLDACNSVITR